MNAKLRPRMPSEHLASLNPAQQSAVTAPDGPTLVLAGAGSGKTRAIIHRMAHLILDRDVAAETILALTFTNRAAGEMKRRVVDLLNGSQPLPGVFTFHALALRLLRQFGSDVGLPDKFTLYASDDRTRLLRRVCRDFSLSEREYSVGRIGAAVSALKQEGFGGKLYARDERERELLTRIAAEYQLRMENVGAVDFDDLLLRALELLECSERCQRFAEARFQHVLVDEYQDTNRVQYRLLRLLAPHGNVFVVGDEDQSIYNFRGADLRNILDFERDFKDATTVKLELNYRSSKPILDAANAVIAHNRERKGKVLTASIPAGELPEVWSFGDDAQEASHIAEQIGRVRGEDQGARIGVLFRTHAQSRLLEEALLVRNLPHLVVGGMRFYERKEIRDAVAYLKLVLNPSDDASFSRVVNVPSRGVGASTLGIIESTGRDNECTLWEASEIALERDSFSGRGRTGVSEFRARVEAVRKLSSSVNLAELVEQSLELTGLNRAFDREGEEQAQTRLENLFQLVAAAEEFEQSVPDANLSDFVDNLGLLSDIDTMDEHAPCLLMTLHSAKGLEFDVVFMPGLEEGLFPHMRAIGNRSGVEEERRLCYVGMTRARRRLVLSHVQLRRTGYRPQVQSPSRFLGEIPDGGLESLSFAQSYQEHPAELSSFDTSHGMTSRGGRSDAAPSSPRSSVSRIREGVSVRHAKFGEGLVVGTSGSGPDQRITVQFHRAGRKRLVAQYAKLEVV